VAHQAARLGVGGNAGRTAAVLGELGTRVRLHTRLGTDVWGDWLEGELTRTGVEFIGKRSGESATNCVATDRSGRRLSFFHPGASHYGTPKPRPDTRFLVVAGCPFPDLGELALWLSKFDEARIPVLTDVGPPLFERPDLAKLARLAGTDMYLTMNEAELGELTGCRDPSEGVRELRTTGFVRIIIKLGPRGALVSTPENGASRRVSTAQLPMGCRSTVGAGDSFNAGFVHGLLCGLDPCHAAALGNRAAHRVLSGSKLGDPSQRVETGSHLDEDIERVKEI